MIQPLLMKEDIDIKNVFIKRNGEVIRRNNEK